MGKRTSRKVRKPEKLQLAPEPYESINKSHEVSHDLASPGPTEPPADIPIPSSGAVTPADESSGYGLTSLSDYTDEEPESHLTSAQRAQIKSEAYEGRFGRPVREYRDGVMARLEDKLRST